MGLFEKNCGSCKGNKSFIKHYVQNNPNTTISGDEVVSKTLSMMKENFRTNPVIDVLRIQRTRDEDEYLHVQFCIFNKKSVKIKNIRFLEWMLVNDLKHFFEMKHKDILRNMVTIEYGYFQGDEEVLGSFKEFNDDEFTEEMTFIILEYAKYMLDIHQ
jgi:hypothetical protein